MRHHRHLLWVQTSSPASIARNTFCNLYATLKSRCWWQECAERRLLVDSSHLDDLAKVIWRPCHSASGVGLSFGLDGYATSSPSPFRSSASRPPSPGTRPRTSCTKEEAAGRAVRQSSILTVTGSGTTATGLTLRRTTRVLTMGL